MQNFKDEQQALTEAQLDMRARCISYVKACETGMKAEGDLKYLAPIFTSMMRELAKIEPR